MSNTAGIVRNSFIPEKAFLAVAQARRKECLSVPVIAAFAALFCAGRKPELYDTSAVGKPHSAVERLARAVERLTSAMEKRTSHVSCNFPSECMCWCIGVALNQGLEIPKLLS